MARKRVRINDPPSRPEDGRVATRMAAEAIRHISEYIKPEDHPAVMYRIYLALRVVMDKDHDEAKLCAKAAKKEEKAKLTGVGQ